MQDARLVALETAERDAMCDFFDAAPRDVRAALGLTHRRIDDGLLMTSSALDICDMNRLTGLGVETPARAASVDEALAALDRAGAKHWAISVIEGDAALRAMCARRGLADRPTVWAKFTRAPAPARQPATRLAVREAPAAQAEAFADTWTAVFAMAPPMARWLCELPGRAGWRCFVAFAGAAPVATGAVYLAPAGAWLGFGATLAEHRGQGAQTALLAARIEAAREAGAGVLTTETGIPAPGEAGPSFHNIQRAGFAIAYRRANMQRR